MTGFYSKYINNYDKIATPLTNLTKKTQNTRPSPPWKSHTINLIFTGAMVGIRNLGGECVGLGDRGLKGTWPRTLPCSSRTPMTIFSLIGETVGNYFWVLELGG